MRILIIDDHPLFRESLRTYVEDCCPDASIREVGTVAEALAVLGEYDDFGLITLDVSLPGMDGISGISPIRQLAPATPLVVMSGLGDASTAHAVLAQGADGYISKSTDGRELRNALHLILRGESYISPCLLTSQLAGTETTALTPLALAAAPQPPPAEEPVGEYGMTPRQLAVCRLLMAGLPNKVIARRLDCAEGTVRLHVSAVLRALNVHNRTEAVQAALRLGIREIA